MSESAQPLQNFSATTMPKTSNVTPSAIERAVKKVIWAAKAYELCPVCGSFKSVDKKLKRFCSFCGTLCETCCDGGKE